MSRFLVNLARRGAGFPVTTVQAPPPSPFGPEIHQHRDKSMETQGAAPVFRRAEEPSIGNTPSPSLSPTSSFEGYRELPEAPTHHVLSIPPLSRAESSTSIQPMVGESAATANRPLRGPTPMPPGRISLDKREAEGASLKSPKPQTRDGAQKLREPALSAPTIHPVPAEPHRFLQFPKATPAYSTVSPAQLPIHVRIGRVEVRAATAPTPTSTPARPNPSAPLGFEGYHRVRNYRS
jgi:hypothetical protein